MKRLQDQVAIVTGASSGFGEAITRLFAREGAKLAIGARRVDRLMALGTELAETEQAKVFVQELDVQNTESVQKFVEGTIKVHRRIDILVNNAGLALGRREVATAEEADWEQMMETNFMGTFRMTKAVLPTLGAQKSGHIVNIGSIADHLPYEGGAGYCGSKFAVRAMTQALRLENIERGIKVSLVDPGLAETEFGLVRFKGDQETAKKVYEGMTPLSAMDVAETVLFVVTRPPHVVIDEVILTPLDQGGVHKVHRRP